MTHRETVPCASCGSPFTVELDRPGRRPRFCSSTCRGRASQARKRRRVTQEIAALVAAAPDSALIRSLAALPPSSAITLRRELERATQAGSSAVGTDEIV